MDKWDKLPSDEMIENTVKALKENNIEAEVVDTEEEAKKRVLEIVPEGKEVFTMTSVTLDKVSIATEVQESGKYNSIRNKLNSMDRASQGMEMQKLGAAPEYAIGSVHAVTEDGKVVVASNSGSQLPAYAHGASHVIWVVGVQKIVKNLDEALKRIYEYTLPLESERAKKAYGSPGSFVSKLLIFNRETTPNRIKLIFVKENIGF